MSRTALVVDDFAQPITFTLNSLGGPGVSQDTWDGIDFDVAYPGWQLQSFDDSAWPGVVAVIVPNPYASGNIAPIAGTSWITNLAVEYHEFGGGRDWLYRRHFTIPDGTVTGATLNIEALYGANIDRLYLNGVDIKNGPFPLDPALFVRGGDNVLAVHLDQIYWLGFTPICYRLDVSYQPIAPAIRLVHAGAGRLALVHHA